MSKGELIKFPPLLVSFFLLWKTTARKAFANYGKRLKRESKRIDEITLYDLGNGFVNRLW